MIINFNTQVQLTQFDWIDGLTVKFEYQASHPVGAARRGRTGAAAPGPVRGRERFLCGRCSS